MDENKLLAVREYLSSKFPDSDIEEKHDFDRSAQTFKIHKEKYSLLLKVGENFIDDNNQEQIKNILESQEIAELLEENKELGVFVSNEPPSIFRRG